MSSGLSESGSNARAMYRITRRRGACRVCRSRKVRCDGAKPCYNCERIGQECTYPESTQPRRRMSGPRAASRWGGTFQPTTPMPPMTPPSSNSSTWSMGNDLSWETAYTDLVSEMDLSNIHETNGLVNVPSAEYGGLFSEAGVESPSGVLSPFEEDGHSSQTQCKISTEEAHEGNYEPQRSSTSDPLHTSGSMITYTEFLDLDPAINNQESNKETPVLTHATKILDFSAVNLYGLLDLIGHGVPESTSLRVTRFIRTLKETLCGSMNDTVGQQDFPTTKWYFEDVAMIPQWCDVFVDEYPSFLQRAYIDDTIEQSRKANAESPVSAFAGAVLAIGSYAALLRESSAPSSKALQKAYQRLFSILESQRSVRSSSDSLLKLQVLILLVIISSMCDHSVTGELIMGAVHCARSLRLFRPWRTQALITNEEHELADNAVRFLYCLEVDHALHQGMPPLLDHDWISHATSSENDGQNHSITECSIFSLMHSVLRRHYSLCTLQSDPCELPWDQMKKLESNEQRLRKWLTGCTPLDDIDCILNASKFLSLLDSSTTWQKRRLLRVFYLYHKAVFFIYCPWIAPLTTKVNDSGVSDGDSLEAALAMRSRCIENSLGSAIVLFQVTSHLILSSTIQERYSTIPAQNQLAIKVLTSMDRDVRNVQQAWQELHQLIPTSCCLILFYMASGGKRERLRVMPCIGTFGALLGRIAVNNKVRALLDDYFTMLTSNGFV